MAAAAILTRNQTSLNLRNAHRAVCRDICYLCEWMVRGSLLRVYSPMHALEAAFDSIILLFFSSFVFHFSSIFASSKSHFFPFIPSVFWNKCCCKSGMVYLLLWSKWSPISPPVSHIFIRVENMQLFPSFFDSQLSAGSALSLFFCYCSFSHIFFHHSYFYKEKFTLAIDFRFCLFSVFTSYSNCEYRECQGSALGLQRWLLVAFLHYWIPCYVGGYFRRSTQPVLPDCPFAVDGWQPPTPAENNKQRFWGGGLLDKGTQWVYQTWPHIYVLEFTNDEESTGISATNAIPSFFQGDYWVSIVPAPHVV